MTKIEELQKEIEDCQEGLRDATYSENHGEMYYWHNMLTIAELNLKSLINNQRQ